MEKIQLVGGGEWRWWVRGTSAGSDGPLKTSERTVRD
jgi:hypothetical protein